MINVIKPLQHLRVLLKRSFVKLLSIQFLKLCLFLLRNQRIIEVRTLLVNPQLLNVSAIE